MRDVLHDQKDALQDILERWEHAVDKIEKEMASIIRNAADARDLFVEANALAADALADMTTEAAQSGVEFGKRKVELKGQVGDQVQGDQGKES